MSSNTKEVKVPIPITGNFTKVASVLGGILKYFQAADCGPEDVFSVVDGILSYAAAQSGSTLVEMAEVVMKRAEVLDRVLSDPSSVEDLSTIAVVDLRPGADHSAWSNGTREDLN